MTNQEKEIRSLNKIIAIQGDLLKMNKDILVPMYKTRIKQLEAQVSELFDTLKAMPTIAENEL